ncbi:uncharacterized protein VDAG_09721 [Verticillium dahliae VdLs.17]|uniref:Uncharacterized protein n=1 Tax=Verticillium dahliae (strain VdLs.17 / ATCC MYA-4575 / FGSC 10137) TaxID=498257 RepID=G2XHG7_VERDV|nr:uncharacterized protein VDAG_09721 [Verticillium dahliae VdLs.17]EGY19261.1 hypothetical protein VDAG_09721 [Verticillium dahliae VdLs.17]
MFEHSEQKRNVICSTGLPRVSSSVADFGDDMTITRTRGDRSIGEIRSRGLYWDVG